ncbi:uncharacterized protein LOC118183667, partial [Stegodyphus dumicola]|uniref:uncharacterized protein LOC118183667 n=1 Tax=Stegodyphus dumicola TaxID=202533 RepID=UPI0015AD1835
MCVSAVKRCEAKFMASGEQHSPSKGQKISTSSSSSRNESNETQWKLLPNNLELSTRSKPSKKQRNKEKLRSFPPEVSSSSSNVAENFSFNPSTFFNCPRAKCNTASWLKDQMVNDEKSKRRAFESDEVFSDSDLSLPHRVNMNFPVTQPFHVAEQHQGFQRPPSRNVVENENTKSTKDEFKKNEADSAIIFERLSHLQDFMSEATTLCEELDDPAVREQFSKLNEAVKHVADEEREKDGLLSQLVSDNGCYSATAGVSPSSSTSKASKGKTAQRVTNGSESYGEEEHANKCNHLLEKMKQSEEKLMALKLQESLLHHMRKKAEKFSGAHGRESLETEDSTFDPLKQSIQDEIVVNGGSHWSADMMSEQRQPLQSTSSDKIEQSFSWKDESQDMKQLHISLEHIKKRVQSMQQISECKNMTDSVSSDDCDDVTDVGQRVAAVELERKKLKNKLIELQEKKKMNDELLKELCYLKDTVSANAVKNGESFLPHSRSSQLQQSKDKREKVGHGGLNADRKLVKLQATLQQLEEMMNALSSEARSQDTNLESADVSSSRLDSRRARSITSVKRDNVRKEQNSGFPARRHYEAEGRANEDADVPAAQAPVLPLGLDKLRDHPEIQDKIEKIRKLHKAQQQVKVINDIMASIQEAKKCGHSIPVEYLHLLSSIEIRDGKNELDESELDTDSEIDEACSNVVPEGSISEDIRTNAKEMCAEMRKNVQNDKENLEHNPAVSADPDDMGIVNSQQNPLAKLQSHFHQLMQMFPVQEQRKDDPIRSSGEGEYSQNRNSSINIPIASRLTAPPVMRQDNIHLTRNASSSMSVASECLTSTPPGGLQDNLQLTRQNIASMESQNQNASANFHHKSCSSLKKDNINNLSGKKGKFCLQKSMAGSYVEMRREPKDNLDSLSTYSTDVSQNRATSNENERKTILDILKSDKKKQKMYDRNKGNQICSNSSIDSEPLEGSNSALAADTTIAATWGGSSTQENFEDENDEQVESLEEQEEDEDSMEVPVLEKKGSVCGRRKVAQFPQQFMQQSVDSISDNSDKTENFHKKAFIRDSHIFHGYPPPPPPKTRPRKMASFSGGVAGSSREIPSSASCSDAISKDNQQHLPSGFVQQLKSHIEQLSALCQAQFLNDKPQVTKSYHQNSSQSIPNMCQPVQAISDMSQPCNQQLLLCLSQCYHALYMQQLEIQHLQRCIRHSMDSEVAHQTNNLNSHSGSSEDMAFRPWCMSTWSNPLLPSNLYLGDQASPLSPASYLQLPVKPHPPLNSNVSGTRPVRAVIHPASQDNRAAQETLNNQVPPRTRANNFWDNFRSYSRQNLLSTTTNMKRNENVGLPVAPQIRQVRPMVPNESTNQTLEMPNSYCSTASSQLYRPSHNPELQVILSRSKKPNAAAMGCAVSCSAPDLQKRAVSSNLNTSSVRNPRSNRHHMQNTESSSKPPVTYGNSVNLIQLHPSQDDSKVG